ncbi:hypothetical protein SBD_3169 [Streptomyces bottropensis ATCC 25435]|uniref:Uncharacterized protein n=1 Tax=Streptomyces bottropensis ATCC 25435 TaxID=1054862 RepID=M3EHS1_9ACTN|nr:hypothetical protein SBD_3169 [Streptomyces bottropensis ATCC 25435]
MRRQVFAARYEREAAWREFKIDESMTVPSTSASVRGVHGCDARPQHHGE